MHRDKPGTFQVRVHGVDRTERIMTTAWSRKEAWPKTMQKKLGLRGENVPVPDDTVWLSSRRTWLLVPHRFGDRYWRPLPELTVGSGWKCEVKRNRLMMWDGDGICFTGLMRVRTAGIGITHKRFCRLKSRCGTNETLIGCVAATTSRVLRRVWPESGGKEKEVRHEKDSGNVRLRVGSCIDDITVWFFYLGRCSRRRAKDTAGNNFGITERLPRSGGIETAETDNRTSDSSEYPRIGGINILLTHAP